MFVHFFGLNKSEFGEFYLGTRKDESAADLRVRQICIISAAAALQLCARLYLLVFARVIVLGRLTASPQLQSPYSVQFGQHLSA
jgi:hypothetical protein